MKKLQGYLKYLLVSQHPWACLHRAWLERMLRGYYDPMYEYQLAHRYGVAEFTGTPTEVREYLRQTAQMC
ncbi:MAG: tRNA 2-selenouridine(34) synthase MnmH, partial [Pseudomonas sp.]